MTAIIELSSPSNQPLAQNDLLKRLRPHWYTDTGTDRLPAQTHVGFVRAKFDHNLIGLELHVRPKTKKHKTNPPASPAPPPKPYSRANPIPQSNIFGFCVTRPVKTPQALTPQDPTHQPNIRDFASPTTRAHRHCTRHAARRTLYAVRPCTIGIYE